MSPQSTVHSPQSNEEVAVKVENLSKVFRLPHEKRTSVKSAFVNLFRKQTYENQRALDDVTFEVKKGEFFGIVGRNGSGKSTLLKLMSGIYVPTKGQIQINGSLVPFIELGVGFNPELTGRENVLLNGALLGFNRKEMLAMYKDIVEFAELEKFMDQKLKNYSSGMQVRLAFSIAIRAQGDILLLDEVLAVGDSAFQQKCFDYFNSLKKGDRTIILVSHNMQIVDQFCDRALLLEQSKIKHIGSSTEIAGMYEDMFMREEAARYKKERSKLAKGNRDTIKIHSVKVLQDSKTVSRVDAGKDFEISVTLESEEELKKANVGINIKNRDKIMLISTDTLVKIGDIHLPRNVKKTVIFKMENVLTNSLYIVNIGVADCTETVPKMLLRKENAQEFIIGGARTYAKNLVNPDISVDIR